ncbi:MAG: FxSxx-COOH system tetratricopeptide repeat protein [Ktedonobacteraceae bacterium]
MVKKAAQATPNPLLRLARLERGWTQKDVADRIGAPLNLNVNRWERGIAAPSAYYVQRLCEVFGKSASELGLLPPQLDGKSSSETPAPESISAPPATARLWNVPFRRNPFFTGRNQLLAALHDQISQHHSTALSQSQALSGLGGIGKTQTAVEYAYRYRDRYQAVFWVRAASRETLVADFAALTHLLELPGQDGQDEMLMVNAVKRWMGQNEGWLLILDNADDLQLVTDFLPSGGTGHVLLTTRTQTTGRIASNLSIEKMETGESVLLLLRRAQLLAVDEPLDTVSRATRIPAQKIAQMLDGLPLALEQAGAYIEAVGCGLSDYLALYERRRIDLLKRQSSFVSDDYPHTVASTWALSFEQVEQANPAAAELLRLCAFLDPDAIPEEIFTEDADSLGSVLSSVITDPLLFNDAIQTLRRYSLIKRDGEAKLLNVHRLVQVVLRDGMDEAEQRQWAERAVRAVSTALPEGSFDTWNRCQRCLPHALICATLIEQFGFTFPEAVSLLEHTGYYIGERGLFSQAELLLHQALTIREQTAGPEHADAANTLHKLAAFYHKQGKHEPAESLLRRALVMREQASGAEHPDTGSTLNALADLYMEQSKYEQAEPLLHQALTIRERALGTEHPDVAESLNDLALLYVYQAKYAQAEPLYEQALSIRQQALEPDHPDLATSLNNLAWLYNYQGRYEQAEPLYLRALAIQEQALEPTHPHIAAGLNNLAELYCNQGKYEQAESLCQRAIAIREQALESNNPFIAASLNNLAEIYRHQGKYEQAEPLHLRALAIREQALGSTHPRVAQSLANLAQLYADQGKYEQAESLYQRALMIYEQALGSEHPDTARVREGYTSFRSLHSSN